MKQSIASMRCLAVDVVLMGAFDWRELSNLLVQAGITPSGTCSCSRGPANRAFRTAHAATHEEGPFGRLIERQLDFRFSDVCTFVHSSEPDAVAQHMTDAGLESHELPAMVWALARDPRPAMGALLSSLCEQVQRASLSAFLAPAPVAETRAIDPPRRR